MKYIDAELLRAEIERFSATEYGDNTFGDDIANGALDYVLEEIIPSLQQEQESVAERFARIVRGNLNGIDKEVQHKFERLYFEITGNKMYGGFND